MPTVARLPGITFRTEAPAAAEGLPRLDVAGFVGFAASGPIDLPVPVEDVARFEEIFGPSLTLAWDSAAGGPAEAQLAPVVRAFFREGGRRCWVVRVAGAADASPGPIAAAASNLLPIPGLLRADGAAAVWGVARSPGSWSDALMVNATLSQRALSVNRSSPPGGGLDVVGAGPREMVRVECADPWGEPGARLTGFLVAPAARPGEGNRRAAARVTPLDGAAGVWFRTARPAELVTGSPPSGLQWQPGPVRVAWLAAPAPRAAPARPGETALAFRRWGALDDRFVVELDRSETGVRAGSWIRVELSASPSVCRSQVLLLQVEEVRDPDSASTSSPPGAAAIWAMARSAWWALDAADAAARLGSVPIMAAAAVELELWCRDAAGQVTRLAGLGPASGHPRWIGALPSDAELFAPPGAPPHACDLRLPPDAAWPSDALLIGAAHPRFPLAMPELERAWPLGFIPLGVSGLQRDGFYQPAVRPAGSPAERNGLSRFAAELFLDPALGADTIASLPSHAFFVEHQSLGTGGRPLTKLHSLYPIEEVSLLSVPDALDRGWEAAPPPPALLEPPTLEAAQRSTAGDDGHTLGWTAVPGADRYCLEESADALFTASHLVFDGAATASARLRPPGLCPTRFYYRVRAIGRRSESGWSNTRSIVVPEETFARCPAREIDAPLLSPPHCDRQEVTLTWTAPPGATRCVVEESAEPLFGLPRVVFDGPSGAGATSVWRDPALAAYYRVRALAGDEPSPWSGTVLAAPDTPAAALELSAATDADPDVPPAAERIPLAVHAAMVRLCAARSDVVAILSLPAHYRERAALAYQERLVSALAGEDPGRTLSFAALFHPWPVTRDAESSGPARLRPVPPDGAVCGLLAARTLGLGAWASPANRAMRGAVSLEPPIAEALTQPLFDAQLNLLRRDPHGIQLLSAATLSADADWRELTVRRLFILLRRLVIREGMREVFAPNDAAFARLMERRFETVLGELFALGAFAGAFRNEAFRVVADESLNTPASIDAGRFIMELRVAPSIPLAFLVIRLLQSGSGLTVTEGA